MTAQDPSSQVSQRLQTVLLLIMIFGAVLALKLFYWQILRGPEMQERAADQTASTVPVYAKRGDIVTNDNVLLAKDVFRYNVYVNVPFVKQPEKLAADLAEILQKPRDSLLANFKMNPKDRVSVAYLESLETAQKITKYKAEQGLLNVELEIRPVRVYPNGSFAAAVVGYINGNRAASGGVELFMSSVLSGTNGSLVGRKNALSDFMPHLAFENNPAIDGAKVTLTIDSGMQRIIEQELQKAIRESRAESGSIIVMDPKTGAILALAVWPAADLNRFFEEVNQGKYGNQTVSALYEPGSVFKIVTYAAGLDAGVITPSTCFQDEGKLIIPGAEVYNANRVVGGNVCLVEALRQSLNVVAAKVALMLGTPRFYSYAAAFGFGSPTRVELGGELAGSVKRPGDGIWRDGLYAYNAFGQGLEATPMQTIAAVAAVANGGKLMRPYIVKSVQRATDAGPVEVKPEVVRQVIRPETAKILTQVLADSIMKESSNLAIVPGYAVAGKTGTSQIMVAGEYDPKQTIASFAGYLPADDPKLVILVKLDKPQSSIWGSHVASPVFASVAKQLVIQAGIAPDAIRLANK